MPPSCADAEESHGRSPRGVSPLEPLVRYPPGSSHCGTAGRTPHFSPRASPIELAPSWHRVGTERERRRHCDRSDERVYIFGQRRDQHRRTDHHAEETAEASFNPQVQGSSPWRPTAFSLLKREWWDRRSTSPRRGFFSSCLARYEHGDPYRDALDGVSGIRRRRRRA